MAGVVVLALAAFVYPAAADSAAVAGFLVLILAH